MVENLVGLMVGLTVVVSVDWLVEQLVGLSV